MNSADVAETDPQAATKLSNGLIVALVVAALIGAYLSELVVDANKERFYTPEPGLPPFPEEFLIERMWNYIYNHSICYGGLGAIMCGLLCAVAGFFRGVSSGIVGLIAGTIVGLVLGVATGVAGHFISEALFPSTLESMFKAMMIFSPLWLVLSLAGTTISALVTGKKGAIVRAIVPSIMGAIIATVAYPILVSILFPVEWPGLSLPLASSVRLTCYVVGALSIVGAILLTLKEPGKEAKVAVESAPEPAA